MASPSSSLDSSTFYQGVQNLSLGSTESQQQPAKPTYSGAEIWGAFRPQNLHVAWNFVSRVAEIKAEKGYGYKNAVQQDLVNTLR